LPKGGAMKRLILLLVLLIASGPGGGSVLISNQAAAADAPGERLGARPGSDYSVERRITAPDLKNRNNDKPFLPDGPATELDAKRLKLIFMLMMGLGQSRAPAR